MLSWERFSAPQAGGGPIGARSIQFVDAWFASRKVSVSGLGSLLGADSELGTRFNLVASGAFLVCFGAKCRVNAPVCSVPVQDFKVLDSVVETVSVDVVDDFRSQQGPSEMLFHKMPVFKDALPVDGDYSVAISINVTPLVIGVVRPKFYESGHSLLASAGVRAKPSGDTVGFKC